MSAPNFCSFRLIFCAMVAALQSIAGQQPGSQHRLAESLQHKLDHIEQNGRRSHPDPTPTVITEDEINDYFAAGRVQLPQGVKKVRFHGHSGLLTGLATIDFDEIRAAQNLSNPLLAIFSGTHNVLLEVHAAASRGIGTVHVRTVSIDGIEAPRIAVEYFLSKYVTPKYPDVAMNSTFRLQDRIDTAIIGYHKLTVTQK